MSLTGLVLHSAETPPDQKNAINAQQLARMNQRVGFRSYQENAASATAEVSEFCYDSAAVSGGADASPLISSSFKRNLSVFRGGQNTAAAASKIVNTSTNMSQV